MEWQAVLLSLKLAATVTLTLTLLGIPLALWLATSRSRSRSYIDALITLPLLLPPTVVGYYLLVSVAKPLAFSFAGIWLGALIMNVPFAIRPFTTAFYAIDRHHVEASLSIGASPLRTFLAIVLPQSWHGLVSGMVLVFAHTIGEFGVVMMLGGNLAGETRTISIAIYDNVQSLNYGAAGRSSLLLTVFAFTALLITFALQPRRVGGI